MSNPIWGTPTEVVKDSYVDKHGNEYYRIKMQDGKEGNHVVKANAEPYFKVGVACQYVIEERPANNQTGVYIKFKKPPSDDNHSNRSSYSGKSDDRATGMMVGNALNNAVVLASTGAIKLEDLEKIADRICQISVDLKAKWDGKG